MQKKRTAQSVAQSEHESGLFVMAAAMSAAGAFFAVMSAVMVFAAIAAVITANSPAYEVVEEVLHAPLSLGIGPMTFSITIEGFVNDFLMAIFFLLVGIELKYEMTVGQLRKPRQAALPMLAAVGGVAAPAVIYLALNAGGAVHGWATPIATDIAFALGVMSLFSATASPLRPRSSSRPSPSPTISLPSWSSPSSTGRRPTLPGLPRLSVWSSCCGSSRA